MRHIPQVPQILLSASKLDGGTHTVRVRFDPFGAWALQPLSQFIPPKSPLPSHLNSGKFMAFRPKANRSRRDSKPFRDRGGRE